MAEEQKIPVLIVDDAADTRESVKKILSLEPSVQVVGEAENGKDGVEKARKLKPTVVLMDINMPVMDGIQATEVVCQEALDIGVIILSVQGEQEYFRKAMVAGAREFLVKPFSPDELLNAVKRVHELSSKRRALLASTAPAPAAEAKKAKIISVFSTKGGVGKSLIATNLAVAIVEATKGKVAILDLDLQFGDVAAMLNAKPKHTIVDAVNHFDSLDMELLSSFFADHPSGLKILPAPLEPAFAETVTGDVIGRILSLLKDNYDFVIIDTDSSFTEATLLALEKSDEIVLLTLLDFPTIKNTNLALKTFKSLNFPEEKTKLVLNRSDSQTGVKVSDLEASLNLKISHNVPSDGKLALPCVNKGEPFVSTAPQSAIAKSIKDLAKTLIGQTEEARPAEKEKAKGGLFRR